MFVRDQTNLLFDFMPSLNVIHGVQSGVHFELTRRPLSIGREGARDIQITDPKVSRRHAMVRFEDGAYVIANVGGKNGIRVNGLLIEEKAKLTNGDEIALGDTVLKYEDSSDPNRTNYVNEVKAATRNDATIVQTPGPGN